MESSKLLTGEVIIVYLATVDSKGDRRVISIKNPQIVYDREQCFISGELFYPHYPKSWVHLRKATVPMNSISYYVEFKTTQEYIDAKPKKKGFWG